MRTTYKICFINGAPWIEELAKELRKRGHIVTSECHSDYDFIIAWSILYMNKVLDVRRKYPHVPLIYYNWDVYEWVWKRPRLGEYDYELYGKLLAESKEVWCPSDCTVKRMQEWYRLNNGLTIKTFIPYYDAPVKDGRYVLNSLRSIPDRNVGWFERACKELNIPYRTSDHKYSLEEYKKILANCTFQVVPYYEASTGGLSLIEGYYLGKPELVSNSPYMGAGDYIGDRAVYFQYNDYQDFKSKLKSMWENPPKIDVKEARRWVKKHYSVGVMANKICERLKNLKS